VGNWGARGIDGKNNKKRLVKNFTMRHFLNFWRAPISRMGMGVARNNFL
jgi:hypothetical protein